MKNALKSNPILSHVIELDEGLFYIKFQPPKFTHVVVMMKNVHFIFFSYRMN